MLIILTKPVIAKPTMYQNYIRDAFKAYVYLGPTTNNYTEIGLGYSPVLGLFLNPPSYPHV